MREWVQPSAKPPFFDDLAMVFDPRRRCCCSPFDARNAAYNLLVIKMVLLCNSLLDYLFNINNEINIGYWTILNFFSQIDATFYVQKTCISFCQTFCLQDISGFVCRSFCWVARHQIPCRAREQGVHLVSVWFESRKDEDGLANRLNAHGLPLNERRLRKRDK